MTIPGTMVVVNQQGVLLMGTSRAGKSELALALIDRGHQLISDDAVVLSKTAGDEISASCPPGLENLLAIRQLGILNIREHFGEQAIRSRCVLTLIIKLNQPYNLLSHNPMTASGQTTEILTEQIPTFLLPKKSATDLALCVEQAVKLTQTKVLA